MINIELHAEQLSDGLSLHRFHIHRNEVKRALQPILQDIYDIGYERGVADSINNVVNIPVHEPELTLETPWSQVDPEIRKEIFLGNVEVVEETVHHERLCDVTAEEAGVKEENNE